MHIKFLGWMLCVLVSAHALADTSTDASARTWDVVPRIIGGDEAEPGDWPWMAGLVHARTSNTYQGQFCAGTLIDPEWVVTAAHCTTGNRASDIDVIIGVHDLRNDLPAGIGERIPVRQIVNHPGYRSRGFKDDIALLQLERPVSGYLPAAPYTGDDSLAAMSSTAIGWGDTNRRLLVSDYPDTLHQVDLPLVSNATCIDAYDDWIPTGTPDSQLDGMICAGYAEGGRDTCSGDSGGPLLVLMGASWELVGITSFGDGCAKPGRYGVYTRVSYYQDFIENTLQGN